MVNADDYYVPSCIIAADDGYNDDTGCNSCGEEVYLSKLIISLKLVNSS